MTFNHPLSFHRCMEDFDRTSWLRYPSSLYFLERNKLRVKPATEPTNVVFEVVQMCVCVCALKKNMKVLFSNVYQPITFLQNIEFSPIKMWWRRKVTMEMLCMVDLPNEHPQHLYMLIIILGNLVCVPSATDCINRYCLEIG